MNTPAQSALDNQAEVFIRLNNALDQSKPAEHDTLMCRNKGKHQQAKP